MTSDNIIALLGVGVGLVISSISIYHSNKSSRNQITINKLEDLYTAIEILAINYDLMMELWNSIQKLNDRNDSSITTKEEYYNIRNSKLSHQLTQELRQHCSRIDVLSKCYTKGKLEKELNDFRKLMFSLLAYVHLGGDIYSEIHSKEGYPNLEEYYKLVNNLQSDIISVIKK